MARRANPESTILTVDLGQYKAAVIRAAKKRDMSASALVRLAISAFLKSDGGKR